MNVEIACKVICRSMTSILEKFMGSSLNILNFTYGVLPILWSHGSLFASSGPGFELWPSQMEDLQICCHGFSAKHTA